MKTFVALLLALCLLQPLMNTACASSIGITIGAPLTSAGVTDTGVRERIELVAAGGLLAGRPQHPSISLITVLAPGVERSHLILRELGRAADKRSLHFAAPPLLVEKTRRATIYLRPSAKDLVVLETIAGQSVRHVPQPVTAVMGNDDFVSGSELYAVSVQGLGPFWILNKDTVDAPTGGNDQSARSLLGMGIDRAVLPVAAAVLLLVLGRIGSVWAHRLDRRGR